MTSKHSLDLRRLRPMSALRTDRSGVAAIELAITMPILLVMLFGIVSYGSWLALSHAVQQSANEAARAAIAGLSQEERAAIASETADASLYSSYGANPEQVVVTADDNGAIFTVNVAYDASANPLLSMPIVPMPPSMIERSTAIRLSSL